MQTATKTRVDQWITAARKNFPELTTFRVPDGWETEVDIVLKAAGASFTMQWHLGNCSVTIGPGVGKKTGVDIPGRAV